MTAFCSNLYSWRRAARLATFVMASTTGWVTCARAQALDSASTELATTTTPYALFQYSTLTGLGNTIFAGRVPVTDSSGTVSYYDVTLLFDVASNGTLTLASGYPKITLSQTLITSDFEAGRYVGPSNVLSGDAIINVSGPGVTSGGATEWSLAAGAGASYYTYPASATWYVGPLTSNPLYARLEKAGITSAAWYYGVGGSSCGCNTWEADTLMGFSQIGSTLTIVSFTKNGVDTSELVDQITYTLQTK